MIERADKLAQAISHLIAFQTGKFTSAMNDPAPSAPPAFDRQKIDEILTSIADEYRHFSLFFGRNGISPAHVIYEQLVHDPATVISYIGKTLRTPEISRLTSLPCRSPSRERTE